METHNTDFKKTISIDLYKAWIKQDHIKARHITTFESVVWVDDLKYNILFPSFKNARGGASMILSELNWDVVAQVKDIPGKGKTVRMDPAWTRSEPSIDLWSIVM